MAVITDNDVTKEFNAAGQNLDHILKLEKMSPPVVATKIALSAFDEIQKSQLGWGYAIKKFLAPTFTYGGVLSLPIVGIVSCIWYFVNAIQNLTSFSSLAIGGTTLGALLAADVAIGRVIGTRPITAILIASYDFYREGARALSKQVRNSYINHEAKMNELIKERHQTIKKELSETYKGMALELVKRYKAQTDVTEPLKILETQLPLISNAFREMGLSKTEIEEILRPLRDAMEFIPRTK